MLYSADALRTIGKIRERIGGMLRERAIDMARRDDRSIVTVDDIWAAFADLDTTDLHLARRAIDNEDDLT